MTAAISSPVSRDLHQLTWWERLGPYYKYFLLGPLAVMLVCFFAGPLLWLFRVSLYQSRGSSGFGIGGADGQSGGGFYVEGTWTLENYARILTDEYFQSITMFTLEFALLVTIVTMLLAYPARSTWHDTASVSGRPAGRCAVNLQAIDPREEFVCCARNRVAIGSAPVHSGFRPTWRLRQWPRPSTP